MTAKAPPVIDAAQIARRSKSNLAFALACLPPARRRDMVSFYAFCRIVDDIADEEGFSVKDRRIQLGAWRRMIRGEQSPANLVARQVVVLPAKYGIEAALFEEIIDGVSMDLERRRYQTFAELQEYCYKVAGAVGLISLDIFGVTDPRARDYAIALGNALQLTNILRDIRTDWDNGQRLYLPLDDLAAHGYTEDDIAARRYNPAFLGLMRFEASRAHRFFGEALAAFPRNESGKLQAAEAMRRVYWALLHKMECGGFQVYNQRYRLSFPRKAAILLSASWQGWWHRWRSRHH
ncbi:MAG: phytoene/squalene synthase family protein [Verrucomicrobiales bacterium]